MSDIRLICSRCKSVDIRKYKVKFKNEIWHVKGKCLNCRRERYLNKEDHFSEDLPELRTDKAKKLDQMTMSYFLD